MPCLTDYEPAPMLVEVIFIFKFNEYLVARGRSDNRFLVLPSFNTFALIVNFKNVSHYVSLKNLLELFRQTALLVGRVVNTFRLLTTISIHFYRLLMLAGRQERL